MNAQTMLQTVGSADYTGHGYREDHRTHHYLKRDLANPACDYLIPRCQTNTWFPDRHPRTEIALGPPWPDEEDRPCPACQARAQGQR